MVWSGHWRFTHFGFIDHERPILKHQINNLIWLLLAIAAPALVYFFSNRNSEEVNLIRLGFYYCAIGALITYLKFGKK